MILLLCFTVALGAEKTFNMQNANGHLRLQATLSNGTLYFSLAHQKKVVIDRVALGLTREDSDFSQGLSVAHFSGPANHSESYSMPQGKRRQIDYAANEYVLSVQNAQGQPMDIVFRLSEDGIGFRYRFPNTTSDLKKITHESTSFKFATGTRAWLQPMSKAKTGWESTNPSYEEPYSMDVDLSHPSPIGQGWIFPALFRSGNTWLALTEAAIDETHCASRLIYDTTSGAMRLAYPQPEEVFTGGGLEPVSKLPWQSPWRLIAVGSLKTLTESTLGTDLARPSVIAQTDFIKGGMASWSWILGKDESVNYDTSKSYIDYASKMQWPYCLIDADWDRRIGFEKMHELVEYGRARNVKLLVWYNSAGAWNTTPYTPKHELLTEESRDKVFSRLVDMGIAGVKIDFFGGDGQSMIAYYEDMLQSAAKHKLLVNFHGATLPRGWQRTYPNLMTVEAVKGQEFITFFQEVADAQPAHCAMLPFARNLFDPMDFTPMVLDRIPNINRRTTQGFELALPTLFLSGIQHLAESPEGMAKMPKFVIDYLKDVPVNWDESRFLDGHPGKFIVMARRSGNTWFITGINGENAPRELVLDLSFWEKANGILIGDGANGFEQSTVQATKKVAVKLKPYGGFVMKF
ncbi:Glycosyl-hydrolase 97 C-terminal, oligomerisation [Flavobacterium caeni]|uniref:Glycosyl-hydrolase 97 C-terminal, oligomerisation n=1 Tax=Flavobacterium caeni TaxID=490189 RepID=A0A1G5GDR0_9FLAO|nr:Glycosyl-hydrolase 97 C-terminal, oligomerisation [Flavobacterium caeni]